MNIGDETFRSLQAAARSFSLASGTPVPTQEYLIRHLLESFLDRLTRTVHAEDFVLKGGILLAAYGARRPTKDVDANAIAAWDGVVEPEWRGRGIYRALTAQRARSAIETGKSMIFSDSTEHSRPILERSGLVKVSTTTPYISTADVDAVIR